ncbi:MAG: hypothetical protein ABDH28_07100 [Brevinematia bacterium]
MNCRKTINHFIKNFLLDLPSKLRKKISEVVLAIKLFWVGRVCWG